MKPTVTTLFKISEVTPSLSLLCPALFFKNFYHCLASFIFFMMLNVYCLSPLVKSIYLRCLEQCLEHRRPSKIFDALASVAQLARAMSPGLKDSSSVPSYGMCLGCGFDPSSGCVQESASRCFSLASMFFSLPSLPSSYSKR